MGDLKEGLDAALNANSYLDGLTKRLERPVTEGDNMSPGDVIFQLLSVMKEASEAIDDLRFYAEHLEKKVRVKEVQEE